MSARDDLHAELSYVVGKALAEEMIDAFAHDLAELIRNSEELRDFTDDHMGDCEAAADLIDPEVAS